MGKADVARYLDVRIEPEFISDYDKAPSHAKKAVERDR